MASAFEVLALSKLSFYDNKPSAILSVTTPQAAVANATFTAIQFDTEVDDNWNGHSNVTNNTRYTCQVAGMYLVRGAVRWASNAVANRLLQIYLNGVAQTNLQTQHFAATAANTANPEIVGLIRLAVGDYIELFAYQNSGGTLVAQAGGTTLQVMFEHF